MNNKLIGALSFSVGAALGSLVTWLLVRDKEKVRADEEIACVKARYKEIYGEKETKEETVVPESEDKEETSMKDYAAALAKNGYTNYSDVVEEPKAPEIKKPYYVITGEEYAELDDYETAELTYWADGVLTNEVNEIIDNIEYTIGVETLSSFNEYGIDAVYVRNDDLKTDYEILYDARNFKDIITPSKLR